MYPFPATKTTKILLMLLMTGLWYVCRDSMYTGAMLGFNKAYLATVVLVAVTGVAFLIHNRKQWKQILLDPKMVVLIVISIIMLAPMLLKRDWQMMYMSVLLCLWIGVFFSFFWNIEDAAKCFVVILSAISVYSILATYILRIFPDQEIFAVPVFYNGSGHMFHHFGLSVVSDEFVRLRNFGIFREPSVFHCFILLALYLNNYTVHWEKEKWLWINNVIFSAAMVSTFATGGFVELAMVALVVFIHKKLYKNKKIWILIGVMAFLLVVIVAVSIYQKNELYWNLHSAFVWKFQPGAESTSDRVGSVVENAKIFFAHPLLGGKLSAVFDTVPNNTSSSTLIFAIFGVFGGLVHVAVWVALVWDKNHSIVSNLTLLLALFMAMNTQNLIADLHFWMLPVMALCQRGLPLVRKRMKE